MGREKPGSSPPSGRALLAGMQQPTQPKRVFARRRLISARNKLLCAAVVVIFAVLRFVGREAEAVYEETLVSPSGLVTGSDAILDTCGLGNSLWIAATLVAVGAMTGKEPVLPKQLGFGANYRQNVFWRFHEVNLASHTWKILDEHAYFFRPIRLKHLKSGTDVQILGYRQSW